MSLIHFDGFDHYSGTTGVGSIQAAYTNAAAGGITTNTRFGTGKCLVGPTLYKGIAGVNGFSTVTVGFAAQLNGSDYVYESQAPVMTQLLDYNNNQLCGILYAPIENRIYIYDSTVNISSGGNTQQGFVEFWTVPATNAWFFIEVCWAKGASANTGSLSVYINGNTIYSNQGGASVGTATCSAWQCYSYLSISNWQFDDFYIANSTSPLGDSRVITLFPNGDTGTEQFTPSAGSAHYSLVNEIVADGDATYVYSNTVGNRDYYTVDPYSNVTTIPPSTIFAVKTCALTRKDLAGNRMLRTNIDSAGTVAHGNALGLSQTYLYQQDLYTVDPATGQAWTVNAVSNAQIGIEITS